VGYAIDVYQESINKTFREYLVNFNYLKRLMANFGFEVVQRDDALKLGLPDGTGMFEQLYVQMMARIKQTPSMASELGDAPDMRDYERRISFYNRYFVFKKVRSIDNAELVVKSLLGTSTAFEKQMAALEQDQDQAELEQAAAVVATAAPNADAKVAKKTVAKAKAQPVAATAAAQPVAKAKAQSEGAVATEKKKPGKPKIQLIVSDKAKI
jgi:hypothetical protein